MRGTGQETVTVPHALLADYWAGKAVIAIGDKGTRVEVQLTHGGITFRPLPDEEDARVEPAKTANR